MVTDLIAIVNSFREAVELAEPSPGFLTTNRGLKDPSWVRAVLVALKDEGVPFKFYTPAQERQFGKSGFCRWDKNGNGGPTLYMSSNLNSLDALRIASHELTHILTITPGHLKEWTEGVKSQLELMAKPGYCWSEAIADTTATLVACIIAPEHREEVFAKSARYVKGYAGTVEYLGEEKNQLLIAETAKRILTNAVRQRSAA